jgi:cobalt-zinc-cadmium efflux system protein
MGAGHDHGAGANTRRLGWALALTGSFLIVEVIGAFAFSSLALLSDAGHMLTDVAALTIALVAIKVGQRPPDDQRTFGYRRFEILAAAFNALMLFAVAFYVLFEGIQRLRDPVEVQTLGMMAVATAGLVVNLISMRILAVGKDESLNMKGAYLEVWADMLGSAGVIAGAALIWFNGWTWVDPVVAIAIGLWVLPRGWVLLRDTTHILLEGVPRGVDFAAVRDAIAKVPGVTAVHDLHLWSLSSNDINVSVHVVLAEGAEAERVRTSVIVTLQAQHMTHIAVQTELEPCAEGPAERHP